MKKVNSTILSCFFNLIIAKNNLGTAYIPEFNFNGIGNLIPGQGYQIKLNEKISIKPSIRLEFVNKNISFLIKDTTITNGSSSYAKLLKYDIKKNTYY